MKLINSAFVIAASLLVFSLQVLAQSSYRVVPIPRPAGDYLGCYLSGISNEGTVLGFCDADFNTNYSFTWKNGVFTDLKAIVGTVSDGSILTARGINSAGAVSFLNAGKVGVIENGVARVLGTLRYPQSGGEIQINDLGDVIYSYSSSSAPISEVFVFRNGTQTVYAPHIAVGRLGMLRGFNNRGEAVFIGSDGGGSRYPSRSYVLDSHTGLVRELPHKGKGIDVSNINDSGVIVGVFSDIKYSFLPFKITNVRVVQLPSAVGYNKDFYAKTKYYVGGINNSGVISGAAFDRIAKGVKVIYPPLGVFMWTNTGIINLTSQFTPFAGKANIFPVGDVSECGAAAFNFLTLASTKDPNPFGAIAIPSSCNF